MVLLVLFELSLHPLYGSKALQATVLIPIILCEKLDDGRTELANEAIGQNMSLSR